MKRRKRQLECRENKDVWLFHPIRNIKRKCFTVLFSLTKFHAIYKTWGESPQTLSDMLIIFELRVTLHKSKYINRPGEYCIFPVLHFFFIFAWIVHIYKGNIIEFFQKCWNKFFFFYKVQHCHKRNKYIAIWANKIFKTKQKNMYVRRKFSVKLKIGGIIWGCKQRNIN